MEDPSGKSFTLDMVDRVFRSHQKNLQAGRLRQVVHRYGVPRYLGLAERVLLRTGATASRVAPSIVMSAVSRQLRRDSSRVVLPCEAGPLTDYLAGRKAENIRVNVNLLGEAILGEEEAAHRLESIVQHLSRSDINYISVKISAIFSQINLVNWEGTLHAIRERLRTLYRVALRGGKFVNLDMEEYRDLALTMEAFQRTLDEPEFKQLRAGIVLQAYLPDSFPALQNLTAWARDRVRNGGAAIKVRLVKGANLAMETVEAELHGWNQAPFASKAETDANFRRMLEFASRPENVHAVNLGVASHNLFDVALALELREANGIGSQVEIEMLEGMASHQARAVHRSAGALLIYAPLVHEKDFNSAMAYLVRRLDENTTPGNFLRDLFGLQPRSPAWQRQEQAFIEGWEHRNHIATRSRRAQLPEVVPGKFYNAPDTDWTQASHRASLHIALDHYTRSVTPAAGNLHDVLQAAASA